MTMAIHLRIAIWLVFFALLLASQMPCASSFDEFVKNREVQVRKTFNGTVKDVGTPANITYVDDSADTFYAIDIAGKMNALEWPPKEEDDEKRQDDGTWAGRIMPTVEYHRNTSTENDNKKADVGLINELGYGFGKCDRDVFGVPDYVQPCKFIIVDFSANLTKDYLADDTTRSYTLFSGLFSKYSEFWPGYEFTTAEDEEKRQYLSFTWYPSVGFEYYDKLPIKKKINGQQVVVANSVDEGFTAARINMNIRPFSQRLRQKLSIVVDYTQRQLIGSSSEVSDNSSFVSVSVTYFLDEKERFGIGYLYEDGENPKNNFLSGEVRSFGFNFKI